MKSEQLNDEQFEEMIARSNRYLSLMQDAINQNNKFVQEWPHKLVMAGYEYGIEIMKKSNLSSMEGSEIKSFITQENIKNIVNSLQFKEWEKASDKDKKIVIEMAHLSIR